MSVRSAWELVAEARQKVVNLSVAQLASELQHGDVLLVDLREQNERELHGVIPGALHAPRGMLEITDHLPGVLHPPETPTASHTRPSTPVTPYRRLTERSGSNPDGAQHRRLGPCTRGPAECHYGDRLRPSLGVQMVPLG